MGRVERIYSAAYNNTPAARESDGRLTDIIHEKVLAGMKDINNMSLEDCTDLVFAGSSYGQAEGFVCGFRYAVALILECLN